MPLTVMTAGAVVEVGSSSPSIMWKSPLSVSSYGALHVGDALTVTVAPDGVPFDSSTGMLVDDGPTLVQNCCGTTPAVSVGNIAAWPPFADDVRSMPIEAASAP